MLRARKMHALTAKFSYVHYSLWWLREVQITGGLRLVFLHARGLLTTPALKWADMEEGGNKQLDPQMDAKRIPSPSKGPI